MKQYTRTLQTALQKRNKQITVLRARIEVQRRLLAAEKRDRATKSAIIERLTRFPKI